MGKVTSLSMARNGRKRVNVFLDGKFAFSLPAEVVVRDNLRVGQELSASQIEALASSDQIYRCLNAATRYLSYRPRSESEIRERLRRRGFDSHSVEAVLAKLKGQGLVDDVSFAQFWKDNRETFSPRSQLLTRRELKQKGVASAIIDQVAGAVDDESSAYRAALSRASRLPLADYPAFRRRLGEYLRRRGFGYGVINHILERVWKELGDSSG